MQYVWKRRRTFEMIPNVIFTEKTINSDKKSCSQMGMWGGGELFPLYITFDLLGGGGALGLFGATQRNARRKGHVLAFEWCFWHVLYISQRWRPSIWILWLQVCRICKLVHTTSYLGTDLDFDSEVLGPRNCESTKTWDRCPSLML